VKIKSLGRQGNQITIGFTAPDEVNIVRDKVLERNKAERGE